MENSMEARVSAAITTFKQVLFEFHFEERVFIKLPCSSKVKRGYHVTVIWDSFSFVSG